MITSTTARSFWNIPKCSLISLVQEDIGRMSDGKTLSVSRSSPRKTCELGHTSLWWPSLPDRSSSSAIFLPCHSIPSNPWWQQWFPTGDIFAHRGHVATSEGTCGCHDWVGVLLASSGEWLGILVNILQFTGQPPQQNISSAKVEKPRSIDLCKCLLVHNRNGQSKHRLGCLQGVSVLLKWFQRSVDLQDTN